MKQITIDASADGICFRCYHSGKIIGLESLPISDSLIQHIRTWMDEYEKVNFDGPTRYQTIDRLERTGVDIALSIVHEINDLNVVYQSDLLLICLLSCSEQKLFVK